MQFQRAILFVALSAATAAVAGVPAGFNVQLMPAGEFRAVDGRPEKLKAWTLDAEAAKAIIAEFDARANPWPIDYEHQTQLAADNGKPAPAAGWIQALTFVPGVGLWAKVEWTATATQYIGEGAYKFISPVFTHDKAGRVKSLLMAALTNTPGIDGMNAVALSALLADRGDGDPVPPNHQKTDGVNMDLLVALRVALGLKETDTAESALSAVASLKAKVDGSDAEIVALKAKAFDPTKHVTLEDHKKVNDELVALRKAGTDAEVASLVDAAIKARQLAPAQKDWAVSLGQKDVAALKAFLKDAPEIAPGATQTGGKGGDGGGGANSDDAEAVALKAQNYIAEQAKLGRVVTAVEAVNHVSPRK
jgi:phage I-like protein